jgi:hypothetical protein
MGAGLRFSRSQGSGLDGALHATKGNGTTEMAQTGLFMPRRGGLHASLVAPIFRTGRWKGAIVSLSREWLARAR